MSRDGRSCAHGCDRKLNILPTPYKVVFEVWSRYIKNHFMKLQMREKRKQSLGYEKNEWSPGVYGIYLPHVLRIHISTTFLYFL